MTFLDNNFGIQIKQIFTDELSKNLCSISQITIIRVLQNSQ
jgi:hypothetical protein